MANSLHGKKILFIGNSYTFYGNTVIHKGYTVLTRERRDNDPGYFYQLCKANGVDVSVTNWTFGSHNLTDFFAENGCDAHRDCHGHRHQDYLEDGYIYYVDSHGNPINFKGMKGDANVGVNAPCLVCTVHTKAAWDAYVESQSGGGVELPEIGEGEGNGE
jgi:hypothetical protein